ncbi:TetR/AcrR family transcriptional regulator [Rhodococcus artemisiae]|uniref:TetR/AcrR family transcriptional regulator n=1 Tax=Rhodococcus artemisiae TaxID=714159 RepID=A0ABU7L5C8_9NOCA|nr:TetR/AcrR family transcriptional regulator [Rhodococcus artemisiae]MEE2056755.1 TetR/AcrR family transcriptional regulator [Rhodococcus artemisiae]
MTTSEVRATEQERRGPGRPRDQDLDQQILMATIELIDADEAVTVTRVIERSGVSRAALYRRWPSVTSLVAAALDVGREVPEPVPSGGDLREAIVALLAGTAIGASEFPEQRFRHRIKLSMEDPELQRAYWNSHVRRRRVPIEDALRNGVMSGVFRSDLDLEACFDLIAGVFYYQMIVRGDRMDDPVVRSRCEAALDVVWRGMLADADGERSASAS